MIGRVNAARQFEPVEVEYFLVSETPYETLQPKCGDDPWDRARFAATHILFAEDNYVRVLFSRGGPGLPSI